LGGCADPPRILPPAAEAGIITDGSFTMADGTVLPYRQWLPEGPPRIVILALHGFNDSRDAFEVPAPYFTAAGIAIIAPDQRGFGATATRGFWPGEAALVSDAIAMARIVRADYPGIPLVLLGESMGGALLMRAAVMPQPPPADAYVLAAPAVWSRAQMGIALSSGLWIVSGVAPWWEVTGTEVPIRVHASDNRAALIRLARDPLTIRRTRFDVLRGLTNSMDDAQQAAPAFTAPGLFMYGGRDDIVPADATAAMWRRLPPTARRALYPTGYHLLLRDNDRRRPIGDILAWLGRPGDYLPSGADLSAAAWLEEQT
jgi:alpha-beta hydrolase superfamily lysophospholipase